MTRIALSSLVGLLAVSTPACLVAQGSITWHDIDCSQSRIAAPAGLRCRETNVFGTQGAATSTGGGQIKAWSAYGSPQGIKLFYYLIESLDTGSSVQPSVLAEDLPKISPQAKGATGLSRVETRSGVDFLTFVSAVKDNCVGIRKGGGPRAGGYRWILFATRCVPAGKPSSEADINAFIASGSVRS